MHGIAHDYHYNVSFAAPSRYLGHVEKNVRPGRGDCVKCVRYSVTQNIGSVAIPYGFIMRLSNVILCFRTFGDSFDLSFRLMFPRAYARTVQFTILCSVLHYELCYV